MQHKDSMQNEEMRDVNKDILESKALSNKDSNTSTTKSSDGKMKGIVKGANDLSLGISMVVAVLLGFLVGYGLYKWLGYYWLIWVGLGYGVAAAVLNVIKAYKRLHRDLESLKNDEKYKYIQDRILEKREKELDECKKNKT